MISKAVGTGAGVIGYLLIIAPGTMIAGLVTWLIGNAAWVYAGVKTHDRYVFGLFGFYFLATVGGLALNLGVV